MALAGEGDVGEDCVQRDGLAALSAAGADTLVVVPFGAGDAVDLLAEARP